METVLEYEKIPGGVSTFLKSLKSLFRKKKFKNGDEFPQMTARVKNISPDPGKLQSYIEVCRLEDDGTLPILYPHVFTGSLQMSIFTNDKFPLPLIGMLHQRNHIMQIRPVRSDEVLDIEVALGEHRVVKQGLEFDYTIKVESEGELLWHSISTYLRPGRFGSDFQISPRSSLIDVMPKGEKFMEFLIPKFIGRKYAWICSDFNPIHFSKSAAKLAGFKRNIAHAMWASSYITGKLNLKKYDGPVRVDLAFKGPLFIESNSCVMRSSEKDSVRFDYYIEGNDRPCIAGKVSYPHIKSPL